MLTPFRVALRRQFHAPSRQSNRRPKKKLGVDWLLEDRIAPATDIALLVDTGTTVEHREPGAAFDGSGRALPGNKSIVQDDLLWLYNAYQDRRENWRQPAPGGVDGVAASPGESLQVDSTGRVLVRINARDVAAIETSLAGLGFNAVSTFPEAQLTEGWLPISALREIESLTPQGLIGAIPVWQPQSTVGLTTSQGDWVAEADRVRSALPSGFNGAGVKVGVLSDSFNKASNPITNASQDVANGDLSGPGNPNGFTTPVQVIEDPSGTWSDEGRGMLQIVHDVAPGAQLAFATAEGGEGNFANNIRALANAGANVIVDDITYFAEPAYQYGLVAKAVQDVTAAGVTYFSSAGNEKDVAWESVAPELYNADLLPNNNPSRPADQGNENWVDMDPNSPSVDLLQTVTIDPQTTVNIFVQWDQPWFINNVRSDIDLEVFDTSGNFVPGLSAESDNISDGTPLESKTWTNNGTSPASLQIGLRLFAGPYFGRIRYENYANHGVGLTINEHATNSPTINRHAGIPEAVGVGAVPYFDQRVRESFTSSGPMTLLYEFNGDRLPSPIISPNPQIAAPDGANTSFFGDDADLDGIPNFFGTSAAAPHAAGVAALILQAYPGSTPADVVQRLVKSADSSTDTPGFDKYTGWGLISAYDAIFGGGPVNKGGSFADDFNSGGLDPQWETFATGAGRIQVTNSGGPLSGAHVVLHERYGDTGNTTGVASRNELTLHLNPNAPGSNGTLLFSVKGFNDQSDPMPASWTISQTGPSNSDGVAFSVDGNTWYRLLSLTGSNLTNSYVAWGADLRVVAANVGVTLSNDTRIRFQQFGNANFPNAGIAFDDINFGGSQGGGGGGGSGITLNTKNRSWNFLDADGDAVTVRFGGSSGTAKLTLTNDIGPIQSIELFNTDSSKSTLTISVRRATQMGGDGQVLLGALTGSGLKSLNANPVNLNGTGINLNGFLGSAKLAAVSNGANIVATGIGSLSIQGDLAGNIALNGQGIFGKPVLGTLRVKGNIVNSTISVAGDVNRVSALSFKNSALFAGFNPVSGQFETQATIKSFQVTGLFEAFDNSQVFATEITTASLRSIKTVPGGPAFGFIADNRIGRLTIGPPTLFRYTPMDGNFKALDNFQVEIV